MKFKISLIVLIILHLVGIIGFSIEATQMLFLKAVPIHLIITAAFLFLNYTGNYRKLFLFISISFLIGFTAELIGVNTALLFGNYSYSGIMGFKLINTPLLIGLLWSTTAYTVNTVLSQYFETKSVFIKVILAGLSMMLLDGILEIFAVKMGLWSWTNGNIPLYNYFTWFMVGCVISFIYYLIIPSNKNRIALFYIDIQLIFFIAYIII